MVQQSAKIAHSTDHEFEMATMVVQKASQFRSTITIVMGDKHVNAKSIMGMTYLMLVDGDEVNVTAQGEDEEKALQEVLTVLTKE